MHFFWIDKIAQSPLLIKELKTESSLENRKYHLTSRTEIPLFGLGGGGSLHFPCFLAFFWVTREGARGTPLLLLGRRIVLRLGSLLGGLLGLLLLVSA